MAERAESDTKSGRGVSSMRRFATDGLSWAGSYGRPPGWGDRAGIGNAVSILDDRIVGSGAQFDTQDQTWDSTPPRVTVREFIDE